MPFLGAYLLTFEAAPQATFGSQELFFWPVAREPCSLTLKTAPGAVFGSLEPLLEPLPTTI